METMPNPVRTLGRERPPRAEARRATAAQALDLAQEVQDLLRCPKCGSRLSASGGGPCCGNAACAIGFPIVNRLPVLICDGESLFCPDDFISRRNTTFDLSRPRIKVAVERLLPKLSQNLRARQNLGAFARLLLERSAHPMVLVVGGSILGCGMESLARDPRIHLVETDVTFGLRTQLIADAHELPFAGSSFDGVVIQAVVQYVPDPAKCVSEIHRVLKPEGVVYAETAFMQQVVHGRYDFTRFTHLGLRRLFRQFQEVASGPTGGPGMALAWSCHFFLLSFASRRFLRSLIHAFAMMTVFWLKYFDALLIHRPGAYDAAAGFFFLGRKSGQTLSDRELAKLYRGPQ